MKINTILELSAVLDGEKFWSIVERGWIVSGTVLSG